MRIVGLTGGIGSGKSVVAKMLAKLGAEVIDADQLAREAVRPGSDGLAEIVSRFGPSVLDPNGELDRRRLGSIVFGDEAARRDLNRIVHPRVAARTAEEIEAAAKRGAEVVVYDVPLLYENALEKTFPEVVVVSVSPETQRGRIATRDRLEQAEIEARIRAQLPLAEKVTRATHVIDNDGTLEQTERQVRALWEKLRA